MRRRSNPVEVALSTYWVRHGCGSSAGVYPTVTYSDWCAPAEVVRGHGLSLRELTEGGGGAILFPMCQSTQGPGNDRVHHAGGRP